MQITIRDVDIDLTAQTLHFGDRWWGVWMYTNDFPDDERLVALFWDKYDALRWVERLEASNDDGCWFEPRNLDVDLAARRRKQGI